jgi:hypothetical protein
MAFKELSPLLSTSVRTYSTRCLSDSGSGILYSVHAERIAYHPLPSATQLWQQKEMARIAHT